MKKERNGERDEREKEIEKGRKRVCGSRRHDERELALC